MKVKARDFLLRLLLDPPAADLPDAILPVPGAPAAEEEIRFAAADGRPLRGLWVAAAGARRGAVVFAPAFEDVSASWRRHVGFLPAAGYDLLALDFRGQGASPPEAGYRPRKWATDRETRDVVAALAEAGRRSGRVPAVVGVSRGAAAAAAAAVAARVAGVVLDSVVSTRAALRERAPRFAAIWIGRPAAGILSPVYGPLVDWTIREAERREGVRFVRLEEDLARLDVPALLVWGERDDLAEAHRADLAAAASTGRTPAEILIVPGARHNAPALVDPEAYRRKVLALLDRAVGGASA